MSATPVPPNPEDDTFADATDQPTPATHPDATAASHPDPITGEPGAHPVGVGVGALGAGAAGAAIGSIGGPIGMLIGAAIGAVAGGLAGKEVAATNDVPAINENTGATSLSSAEEPPVVLPADVPTPITMGSVPGEGFRAVSGSGFADDASLSTAGASTLPATPPVDLEDDALPMTAATGLQEPPTSEDEPLMGSTTMPAKDEPLMGSTMPANGEEAVRVAAYYHYLERMRSGQSGDAVADWLEAEHETI